MSFAHVFHIVFSSLDIFFHIIPSINAESENKGGGGVSPPGVFDKNIKNYGLIHLVEVADSPTKNNEKPVFDRKSIFSI